MPLLISDAAAQAVTAIGEPTSVTALLPVTTSVPPVRIATVAPGV